MADPILVDKADGIATVTFNRPERLNALTYDMMQRQIPGLWPILEADPEVRVVIVTGAGDRAFSSGLDVKEAAESPPDYRRSGARPPGLTPRAQDFSKPVITAVNGLCGGVGLAFISDADIAIAAEHAYLFNPGVTIGQLAMYAPVTWVRSVPFQALMRFVLVGNQERIGAQQAKELGMVTEVVAKDHLMDRARELAALIAYNSPTAVRYAKRILWDALDHGMRDALKHAQATMARYSGHPDMAEGPRALVEKRPPQWAEVED